MKSKTARRIHKETPQEIKDKAQAYAAKCVIESGGIEAWLKKSSENMDAHYVKNIDVFKRLKDK